MLRADKFTWITFPKTMLGAGFFHKVFSLIFLSVAFEAFPKAPLFGNDDYKLRTNGQFLVERNRRFLFEYARWSSMVFASILKRTF